GAGAGAGGEPGGSLAGGSARRSSCGWRARGRRCRRLRSGCLGGDCRGSDAAAACGCRCSGGAAARHDRPGAAVGLRRSGTNGLPTLPAERRGSGVADGVANSGWRLRRGRLAGAAVRHRGRCPSTGPRRAAAVGGRDCARGGAARRGGAAAVAVVGARLADATLRGGSGGMAGARAGGRDGDGSLDAALGDRAGAAPRPELARALVLPAAAAAGLQHQRRRRIGGRGGDAALRPGPRAPLGDGATAAAAAAQRGSTGRSCGPCQWCQSQQPQYRRRRFWGQQRRQWRCRGGCGRRRGTGAAGWTAAEGAADFHLQQPVPAGAALRPALRPRGPLPPCKQWLLAGRAAAAGPSVRNGRRVRCRRLLLPLLVRSSTCCCCAGRR
ncbi:unnamed protein product, partial [Phaeothamnion confervicola]